MNHYSVVFCVVLCKFNIINLAEVSGYDLGASCEYDVDCIADHSYCQNQRTCQCKRGFIPAPDGTTCLANVGATCRSKLDCLTLPHSDCQQDVCMCEPDFVPAETGLECLPRVKQIRASCQQDNQCQASFGDQSHCYGGHCECMMRYHFLNGRCFLTRDLDESCSNSSQCYIGPDYTATIECRDQRCRCVTGYYVNQYRKCTRSTGNFETSKPAVLLVLISTIMYLLGKNSTQCIIH